MLMKILQQNSWSTLSWKQLMLLRTSSNPMWSIGFVLYIPPRGMRNLARVKELLWEIPPAVFRKLVPSKMKKVLTTETDDASIRHGENSSILDFDRRLEKIIKDMDLIEEQAKKVVKEKVVEKDTFVLPTPTAAPLPNMGKNVVRMVGFEEYLNRAMEKLTGQGLNRQVVPIVGMGGIGKTTLAKHIYVHPYIINYFDLRAWTAISQEYSSRKVLLCLLHEISGGSVDQQGREDELGEELYKELCGRRYFIILDDIWSIEAWEKMMRFFPENDNGSRIMITTRISDLASHIGSCRFQIGFLDDDKSWDLFYQKVFGNEDCPDLKLLELGKMIARKCRGLPLSIVTIAGLLAKSKKTVEYWTFVVENLSSMLTSDDNEHCLKILSLSYRHLPAHLKPCFLYMGVFPEDYEIRVSKLIRLWVAEGFLRPDKAKSSEEIAEEFLHDLIGRNLVSVLGWGSRVKIKSITDHDLLRELSFDRCGHSVEHRLEMLTIPLFLKYLSLIMSHLPWESMTMIGALPHLEVLKLEEDAFVGDEWDAVETHQGTELFRSLKLLRILYSGSPKYWIADETSFPCLESLCIISSDLMEIPLEIGGIPTLRSISLLNCLPSVIESAKRILEEQRS